MGCPFTDFVSTAAPIRKKSWKHAHNNLFYLRASNCESVYTEFAELDGWKTIEINFQKCEVRSLKFNRFMKEKGYRLVIQRTRIEHEPDLFLTSSLFCVIT